MPPAELEAESSRLPGIPEEFSNPHSSFQAPMPLDTPKLSWSFALKQRWGEVNNVVWIVDDVSSFDEDNWQWGGDGY